MTITRLSRPRHLAEQLWKVAGCGCWECRAIRHAALRRLAGYGLVLLVIVGGISHR